MSSISSVRRGFAPQGLFAPALAVPALREAVVMLSPRRLVRNPVMFVTELGAALSTLSGLSALASAHESGGYQLLVSAILWLTVLFANFAEALAEARGQAQTQALRETRKATPARRRGQNGS
ncbi:MAG: potassium-transporting ATPase subunit B, partial [Polyangiaceae bacterium]